MEIKLTDKLRLRLLAPVASSQLQFTLTFSDPYTAGAYVGYTKDTTPVDMVPATRAV